MKSSKLLIVVLVLQALTLAGQWLGSPRILPAAQAQMANPGADRAEMIDQIKSVNTRLDKLIAILESGKLQVLTTSTDDGKDANAPR